MLRAAADVLHAGPCFLRKGLFWLLLAATLRQPPLVGLLLQDSLMRSVAVSATVPVSRCAALQCRDGLQGTQWKPGDGFKQQPRCCTAAKYKSSLQCTPHSSQRGTLQLIAW